MNRARNKKFVREMMHYARDLGVVRVVVEYGSKHPFIVGSYCGSEFRQVIPSSPYNEERAMQRARCNFRRAIRAISESHGGVESETRAKADGCVQVSTAGCG